MKFLDLNENLEKEISPIYLVTGQDAFLIQKTISTLKKKVVTDYEELNFDKFDLENFNLKNIINSANSLPFMADKKLIVVKELPKLGKEEELILQSYALNPNNAVCLVLVSDEKAFNKLENKQIIDCSNLNTSDLLKLIASRAQKNGRTVGLEAGKLLIEKCDSDALRIVNELEKLTAFTNEKLITELQVSELVTDSFELNIFKLTNSLAVKDNQTTLEILNDMLTSKVEPSSIIYAISSNFRRMFLSSISTDYTNDQISDLLGVKPFAILKAKENAKKFQVKNLKRINELLEEVDYMLKSGQMSATNCVYYLVFNILTF